MGLIIFFTIVFIFMVIDDINLEKDIKSSSKIKWSQKDAEDYYKQTNK